MVLNKNSVNSITPYLCVEKTKVKQIIKTQHKDELYLLHFSTFKT